MTKGVKVCIALIAVIFVTALAVSVMMFSKSDGNYVEIVRDNEILYRFNLSNAENQTIRIDYENGGYNTVEIADGRIRISEADCPDKTCVNTGVLSGDIPIVCLPHRLVVKFSSENED